MAITIATSRSHTYTSCSCKEKVPTNVKFAVPIWNLLYLRMDGKRGHVTCGNRLAIERQESFQKFASLEEELLLPSAQACWDPTRFRMAWYEEKWLQLDKMNMFFKIYAWCLLHFSERRLAWLWVSLGNFSFMLIWWSFQVRALHNVHQCSFMRYRLEIGKRRDEFIISFIIAKDYLLSCFYKCQ